MNKKIKIALLKETKMPPDKRAALSPTQALELTKNFPNVELYIQSSNIRAFSDSEYTDRGLTVTKDVNHCDIMLGVKEVAISKLQANKTYFFFSHTAKKQEYNRDLLQNLLEKNIRMIDYEYLTYESGVRIIAFGRWAGLVGAYNGLRAYGKREGLFNLKQAINTGGTQEMFNELKNKAKFPPVKILLTGGGRVAQGALETLSIPDITAIKPHEFLNNEYDQPVFTQLDPGDYVYHKHNKPFELQHFFNHPEEYESSFARYTHKADIYIACHFWDEKSPKFIPKELLKQPDFNIKVIADVSCDIAGPIASTIRPSEIANPYYGYDIEAESEGYPFDKFNLTVMAVDNLPGEVPRDASEDFSHVLIKNIMPALLHEDTDGIIQRATITNAGKLGPHFTYLKDFSEGKE
ncbi:MAG: NAD(P)-dependent oxidoreductase [Bacteroidota bacterium]|nr:NAD(P)-dependent oxidoreductase [Bacteroidota bacterium]